MAQMVKNLPAMQATTVRSPGREDLLEEDMATHSSILAWIIPWAEEPGGLQSLGLKNTGVDCHFLLQGILPTQELPPALQANSLPSEL